MFDTKRLRNPALREFAKDHLAGAGRFFNLGTPVLSDDDLIVVSANMKNGAYTIAAQPDVPRITTITHAIVATGTDTLGIITCVGKDIEGQPISEVITPLAGAVASGTKAFASYDSIIGSGWAIAGGNDTIKIGVGPALGLPVKIAAEAECMLGILGTAIIAPTVTAADDIASCTIDISSGTYNGTKKAFAIIVE